LGWKTSQQCPNKSVERRIAGILAPACKAGNKLWTGHTENFPKNGALITITECRFETKEYPQTGPYHVHDRCRADVVNDDARISMGEEPFE